MSNMGICRYVYCLCIMFVFAYQVSGNQLQSEERYRRQSGYDARCNVLQAKFGENVTNFTNKNREVIYEFKYGLVNKTTASRVTVTALEASMDNPILFVVRQQHDTMSWKVPFNNPEHTSTYNVVSRNLCPFPVTNKDFSAKNLSIFVDVYSFSNNNLHFSIHVDFVKDFNLRIGEIRNVNISPSEPQYFMYTFPDSVDSVLVHASSDSDLCMIFSVQDVKCPVFDLEQSVEFSGIHQTMTKQAAITVKKSNYDQKSFYIVTVLKPSDYACNGIETIHAAGYTRRKQLTLQVNGTISAEKYYVAIIGAVSVFIGIYLVTFPVAVLLCDCKDNSGVKDTNRDTEETNPLTGKYLADTDSRPSMAGSARPETNSNPNRRRQKPYPDSENDVDLPNDATSEQNVPRTQTVLYVSDLARNPKIQQEKKYNLFWRNLVAISIFYGLPVLQLVMTYQKDLHVTGDQDICYYNFDCLRPLGVLSAFNNVFSNIGYILLGLLFILLVKKKETVKKNPSVETKNGLPQHSGLLYAMGLALFMEGVMSGCYHFCPNYSNFQFDTSFMYIIACLCMLRIYQSRHPDISANAHKSYLVMAFVIFIAFVGVVFNTNIFWILFALIDMLASLILSAYIYYMGNFKMNTEIVTKIFSLRYECGHCTTPVYKDRLVILVIGNVLNWSFAIYGAVTWPSDFASFLLGIFIGNLLLYSLFYIIMKLRYKEKIHPVAVICIVTAMVFWSIALYFFFAHLTSWQLTPSQSREGNKNCILLDFYDAHDVWHFLSAVAVFTSFLLTPAQSREGNERCIWLDFYDAHDVWHFFSAIALFFSFLVLLTLNDDLDLTSYHSMSEQLQNL